MGQINSAERTEKSEGMTNFRSLDEFWVFYLTQHSKPWTRRWHLIGTFGSIFFLVISVLISWWFLALVPVTGYGCAWYSHFFVEGNVPATFGHPIWSFLCDYKMVGLMLTRNMDREIKRVGKRPVVQPFKAGEGFSDRVIELYP